GSTGDVSQHRQCVHPERPQPRDFLVRHRQVLGGGYTVITELVDRGRDSPVIRSSEVLGPLEGPDNVVVYLRNSIRAGQTELEPHVSPFCPTIDPTTSQ